MIPLGLHKIASGSKDNTIKIWNISDASCIKTLLGHTKYIWKLVSINEEKFVSASFDLSIKVW